MFSPLVYSDCGEFRRLSRPEICFIDNYCKNTGGNFKNIHIALFLHFLYSETCCDNILSTSVNMAIESLNFGRYLSYISCHGSTYIDRITTIMGGSMEERWADVSFHDSEFCWRNDV